MVKTSPDGRFRFVKGGSGGSGGTAYDTENGLLVGWNELNLRGMSAHERRSTARSIDLLQGLTHDHVLGVHSYWEASKAGPMERQSRSLLWHGGETSAGQGERVVFLTTPCITLEAFVETKVEFLRWRVVKRWSRQILQALRFLHQQAPPVVHKNLSLSTVYIDPSKSHIFVGGVRDIIAPAPRSRPTKQPKGGGGGGAGGDGRQKSWGDRAWGMVAAGGMGCGMDNAVGGSVSDDDDESCATEEGEGKDREEGAREEGEGCGGCGGGGGGGGDDAEYGGGEEGCSGARDVRAFATTLIEMVLKRRLDPALARDEQFLEMLPVISGWPASVVDLLRSCRAPADERPSAYELLQHPFFELGNELDDQPVYGDAELIAAAFAAATALRSNGDGSGNGGDLTGAAAAAAAVATANGNITPQSAQYRRPSPPPPLFTSHHTPGTGAGAAGAAPHTWGALAATVTPSARGGRGGYHSGHGGAGANWTPPVSASCDWSSPAGGGAYGYTPSCSTESPSPSSPSAAPCFGGVPTTPSSPPAAAPPMSTSSHSSTVSSSTSSSRGLGHYPDFGASGAGYGAGFGGAGAGRRENFPRVVLPAGVTPAAYANAAAIAARMQQQQWRVTAASSNDNTVPGDDGGDDLGEHAGRNRAVSYSDRQHLVSAAGGGRGGGGQLGSGGRDFGIPLREEGAGEAVTGRARSASEDAVWDMLPSDESQCRRPFSVSAVEGRHGY